MLNESNLVVGSRYIGGVGRQSRKLYMPQASEFCALWSSAEWVWCSVRAQKLCVISILLFAHPAYRNKSSASNVSYNRYHGWLFRALYLVPRDSSRQSSRKCKYSTLFFYAAVPRVEESRDTTCLLWKLSHMGYTMTSEYANCKASYHVSYQVHRQCSCICAFNLMSSPIMRGILTTSTVVRLAVRTCHTASFLRSSKASQTRGRVPRN